MRSFSPCGWSPSTVLATGLRWNASTRAPQTPARAHLGLPLSGYITQLAEVIRTEDPRLDGPGDLFELDLLRPRPAVMTHKPGRSMSDGDTTISFTNSGHAHIGAQVGAAHEPITITMAADTGQDMDQEAAPHEEDEPGPDSGQQSSR